MEEIVQVNDLIIGYKKSGIEKVVAGPANLSLFAGEFVCMIGQNGSGKTTLLKTLAGVHKPLQGTVKIHSKNILSYKPSELSRLLSVVLTDRITVGNLNVFTLVSLGRFPYTNWLGGLKAKDRQIIEWALEITNTKKFENRQLGELSDGELQKTMIARALTQDTDIILLDEPTAHLDLPNRIEIFLLLKKLAHETNKVILISTHELDLALQTADNIWLVHDNANSDKVPGPRFNKILSGIPEDMVLNGDLQRAFEKHGMHFDQRTGRFEIKSKVYTTVNLNGPKILSYWTSRALERVGFKVDNSILSSIQIEISEENRRWSGKIYGNQFSVTSIKELLCLVSPKQVESVMNNN